jgi:hypothetical protein
MHISKFIPFDLQLSVYFVRPRTDAPATVAPQQHLLPRPRSSPNQNQNSLSVSSRPTSTSSSSSTSSPSLRRAPTPSTIRRASVVGEQVSGEQTVVLPYFVISKCRFNHRTVLCGFVSYKCKLVVMYSNFGSIELRTIF